MPFLSGSPAAVLEHDASDDQQEAQRGGKIDWFVNYKMEEYKRDEWSKIDEVADPVGCLSQLQCPQP